MQQILPQHTHTHTHTNRSLKAFNNSSTYQDFIECDQYAWQQMCVNVIQLSVAQCSFNNVSEGTPATDDTMKRRCMGGNQSVSVSKYVHVSLLSLHHLLSPTSSLLFLLQITLCPHFLFSSPVFTFQHLLSPPPLSCSFPLSIWLFLPTQMLGWLAGWLADSWIPRSLVADVK